MSEREDRAKALALASNGPNWEDMQPTERDVFRKQAAREGFASEVGHEVGDAAAEVKGQCRDRLESLSALQRLSRGDDIDEFSNDEMLALGIGYGQAGPLPDTEIEGQASEALDALPLAVERTVAFEVVLGTGGPDDRLVFECSAGGDVGEGMHSFEIRRVLYRYSWTGSAEIELDGEDRQVAEELAGRTVPELAEAL